jgi:hypothetical protein
LTTLQNKVKDIHVDSAPATVDHKRQAIHINPSMAISGGMLSLRYRPFKKVRCITEMVIHIAEETEKAIIGTQHEDDQSDDKSQNEGVDASNMLHQALDLTSK